MSETIFCQTFGTPCGELIAIGPTDGIEPRLLVGSKERFLTLAA